MKVNSKKLLSWLCVIAMVLSLAPVMDLSNFAVETNAAAGDTNWTAAGITDPAGNSIDNSDTALQGHIDNKTCPVCGDLSGLATNEQWTEWTGVSGNKDFASLTGKRHIYIGSSFELGKYIRTSGTSTGGAVCIWLKEGVTLTMTGGTSSYIRPGGGGTINIFGKGSITKSTGGYLFELHNNGTLNLYGGNFVYKNVTDSYTYGVIAFNQSSGYTGEANIYNGATLGPETADAGAVYMNVYIGKADGTVNMYGGTVRNGVSGSRLVSGNVHVIKDTAFNMYGGTIQNGRNITDTTSAKCGANLYLVSGAAVNIYGGEIKGGQADRGGNIYLAASETTVFNMQGGKVTGGNATDGGNIYSSAGITIGGTALIQTGAATENGGNIHMATGTATISGGTIDNGSAAKGGNIYMAAGTATISDGTIQEGANNVYIYTGDCTMTGGTITGGERSGAGANVYLYGEGANFSMQGGVISRGYNTATEAKTRQANVQVNAGGSFTLKEGTRLQNQATLVDNEGYDAWYATDADALAAYGSNTVYMTLANTALTLDKNVVINTKGYDVTLSGSGNVQLIDTANHDFETASGKVTVTESVEITENDVTVNDKRYITIKDSNGDYSAHYVKMALTGIALRTNEDGLYYAGQFQCDDTLAGCVTQFGIAVSAGDTMPTDLTGKYSIYDGTNFAPVEHVVTAYGVEVFGILKEVGTDGRDGATNLAYLQMQVNANPYMKINTGDETITIMACEDSTADKFGSKTLLDVVETINGKWDADYKAGLSENAAQGMLDFVARWTNADKMGSEGVQTMIDATGNIV